MTAVLIKLGSTEKMYQPPQTEEMTVVLMKSGSTEKCTRLHNLDVFVLHHISLSGKKIFFKREMIASVKFCIKKMVNLSDFSCTSVHIKCAHHFTRFFITQLRVRNNCKSYCRTRNLFSIGNWNVLAYQWDKH